MSKEKKAAGKGKAATPEQKRRFEQAKGKQMDKSQPAFDPDSDEDTTGKSEAFAKRRTGADRSRK